MAAVPNAETGNATDKDPDMLSEESQTLSDVFSASDPTPTASFEPETIDADKAAKEIVKAEAMKEAAKKAVSGKARKVIDSDEDESDEADEAEEDDGEEEEEDDDDDDYEQQVPQTHNLTNDELLTKAVSWTETASAYLNGANVLKGKSIKGFETMLSSEYRDKYPANLSFDRVMQLASNTIPKPVKEAKEKPDRKPIAKDLADELVKICKAENLKQQAAGKFQTPVHGIKIDPYMDISGIIGDQEVEKKIIDNTLSTMKGADMLTWFCRMLIGRFVLAHRMKARNDVDWGSYRAWLTASGLEPSFAYTCSTLAAFFYCIPNIILHSRVSVILNSPKQVLNVLLSSDYADFHGVLTTKFMGASINLQGQTLQFSDYTGLPISYLSVFISKGYKSFSHSEPTDEELKKGMPIWDQKFQKGLDQKKKRPPNWDDVPDMTGTILTKRQKTVIQNVMTMKLPGEDLGESKPYAGKAVKDGDNADTIITHAQIVHINPLPDGKTATRCNGMQIFNMPIDARLSDLITAFNNRFCKSNLVDCEGYKFLYVKMVGKNNVQRIDSPSDMKIKDVPKYGSFPTIEIHLSMKAAAEPLELLEPDPDPPGFMADWYEELQEELCDEEVTGDDPVQQVGEIAAWCQTEMAKHVQWSNNRIEELEAELKGLRMMFYQNSHQVEVSLGQIGLKFRKMDELIEGRVPFYENLTGKDPLRDFIDGLLKAPEFTREDLIKVAQVKKVQMLNIDDPKTELERFRGVQEVKNAIGRSIPVDQESMTKTRVEAIRPMLQQLRDIMWPEKIAEQKRMELQKQSESAAGPPRDEMVAPAYTA